MRIILNKDAAKAWREGGEQWNPISSRIISARLKLQEDKSRRRPRLLSIISVYAPTFRSSQDEKDRFYEELQNEIDGILPSDILIVMGDLNARVGSNDGNTSWDGVLGMHGLGKMNEAGLSLLSFCCMNNLSIVNTFFEKRDIHKRTWQHPGTRDWHCIDYVLMRQNQKKLCIDAHVMRGAKCWSDHKMLRAKLAVAFSHLPRSKRSKSNSQKHFNYSYLKDENIRSEFDSKVADLLNQNWESCESVQAKWEVLVKGTMESAKQVLPISNANSPDWFIENEQIIRPELERRDSLHRQWLSSSSSTNRVKYVKQKSKVQKNAKNKWFQARASEIEYSMNRSSAKWESIRKLQKVTRGILPTIPRAVRSKDGSLCQTPQQCHER